MLRASLILFLFASSLYARTPLVRVFCTEMLFSRDQGVPLESSAEAWNEFVERLEERTLRPEVVQKIDPARLQLCLTDFRDEIEQGEFLLEGKQLLASLVRQSQEKKTDRGLEPVLGSVNFPGFGEVPMGGITRRAEVSSPERVTQRSTHYEALWEAFLGRLRKTMTMRRYPLKIK